MITIQRYMATRDPFRNTRLPLYMASAELREYGLGILLNPIKIFFYFLFFIAIEIFFLFKSIIKLI